MLLTSVQKRPVNGFKEQNACLRGKYVPLKSTVRTLISQFYGVKISQNSKIGLNRQAFRSQIRESVN